MRSWTAWSCGGRRAISNSVADDYRITGICRQERGIDGNVWINVGGSSLDVVALIGVLLPVNPATDAKILKPI